MRMSPASRPTVVIAAMVITAVVIAAARPARADMVEVVAANLPPMMTESGEGREAELIRAALERCDHDVIFRVQPFTRHWENFQEGVGDAVATVPPGYPIGAETTEPYIQFQNGVSVLASKEPSVERLSDLAGRNVIAFGDASEILPGLKEAVPGFAGYREVTDQIVQSRMLFANRTDAVIGDGMLLAEYNRSLLETPGSLSFDPSQPVIFTKIFEPSDYVMAFRDAALADDFDRCFAEIRADGTVDAINSAWVDRYRDVLGNDYLGY